MVKHIMYGLPGIGYFRIVRHHPAPVQLTTAPHLDSIGVPVQPLAFVAICHHWQPVSGIKVKRLCYCNHHFPHENNESWSLACDRAGTSIAYLEHFVPSKLCAPADAQR